MFRTPAIHKKSPSKEFTKLQINSNNLKVIQGEDLQTLDRESTDFNLSNLDKSSCGYAEVKRIQKCFIVIEGDSIDVDHKRS